MDTRLREEPKAKELETFPVAERGKVTRKGTPRETLEASLEPMPFKSLLSSLTDKKSREIARCVYKWANSGGDLSMPSEELLWELFDEYPGWEGLLRSKHKPKNLDHDSDFDC